MSKKIPYGNFEATLLQHLTDTNDERRNDPDFIISRVLVAEETFENRRLEGYSPNDALEFAEEALINGI